MEHVEVALQRLDPRKRFIIEQRVMNERTLTLEEPGEHFGFSRERARQLEIRAGEARAFLLASQCYKLWHCWEPPWCA